MRDLCSFVRRPRLLMSGLCVAAGLFLPVGEVIGQVEPTAPVVDDDGQPQVRFNFKSQSWDQVLDYFSRATGMPIVKSVEVPKGTVDYFHPTPYPLPRALETLNILLQTQNVMVRQDDGRLVLEGLDESRRLNVLKDLSRNIPKRPKALGSGSSSPIFTSRWRRSLSSLLKKISRSRWMKIQISSW